MLTVNHPGGVRDVPSVVDDRHQLPAARRKDQTPVESIP